MTSNKPIPDHVSLTSLAAFCGISANGIRKMVIEKRIPKPIPKSGFPFQETIVSILKDERAKRDKDTGAADRARRSKAEADSAELDSMSKQGKLCLLTDAKMYVSETRIAIRQMIEGAAYLSEVQRKKLLTEAMEIKIAEPGAEENA